MTTRRGFIQSVVAAIGAVVMPKVAVAESEVPIAITEQTEEFGAAADKIIIFARAVTQARIDEYTDQGFTVLVTGWTDDN